MSEGGAYHDVKRCAKCAAWIPTTATMCAYCGTSSPDQPLARGRGSVLSLRHGVSATNALIAANAAFFVFSLAVTGLRGVPGNVAQWALTGGGNFHLGVVLCGGYVHSLVAAGQWWRLVSGAFLHFGLIHIGLNMLALRDLGRLAEELFGTARFLAVYLLSGAASMAAVSLWYVHLHPRPGPVPVTAGASGAIFGVLGMLAVFLLRAGTERARAIGMALAKNAAFMLLVGFVVPVISNTAHVGGLLVGAGAGFVLRDRFSSRFSVEARTRWTRLAAALVGVAAVALALAMRFALTWNGGSA